MWLLPILLLSTTSFYKSSAKTLAFSQRADEEDPYRLPKTVLPDSYAVTIIVEEDFATKGAFTGSVSINLKAVEDVEEVTLHARFLAISEDKVELTCGNSTNLFDSLSNETDYHKIFIKAKNVIPAGTTCTLKFEDFVGELQDDMNGFYRSWYENENGEIEWLGSTQFQPVHARRAFPCFDEPEFKATFTLTLYHPEGYTAISNTPLSSNSTSPAGLIIDVFETTPLMSTYLVAFIVSKFEYIQTWENYKIFARKEALDTAEFISYVTPYFVQNLEKFTDIQYVSGGISKIDQVALPDFDAGAMENWGLITYRERALLWDPEHSSNSYKQSITMTVAHELTHMWFGNLVTCQWWSYTWLNEGFARYFQYMTPGEIDEIDKWELDNQFVTLVVQAVFTSDSVIGATPLTSSASTPSDIATKFNTITYSKGASVIRMMEHFMGNENFTAGLRAYLKAHQHGATTPDDLFEALAPYATNLPEGRSFKDVLTLWTEQSGYPVIQVSLSGADAVITQKQFLYDTSSNSNSMWDIPLTYTISHDPNFENVYSPTWFPATKSSVTIPNILHGGSGWVVFNLQEVGYYRVNYDDVLWSEIEEALKSEDFDGIHVLNRAQIVDDVLNLARARIVTYTRALDVISYLEDEEEYYPWYSALTALSYVKRRIGNDATLKELFDTFVSSILTDVLDTVPFNDSNTDHVFTLKRHLLLTWACQLNTGDCVQKSQEVFNNYKNDGVSVDPNLRSVVYCNALRYAETPDNFYFLWDEYQNTKLSTEQVTILATLGCTKNASLLTEYMEKTLSNTSKIRVQDYSTLFTSVLDSNYEGLSVLLQFLINNYQVLPNYYPSWASLFGSLAERYTTEEEVEELRTFYDENKESLSDVASTIESAISTAKANIEWTTSVRSELTNRLRGSASSVVVNTTLLFVCAFLARLFMN